MAKIKVHAGDFNKTSMNQFSYAFGQGTFILSSDAHKIMGEKISITQVSEIDTASEDSVKRIGGTVGWGVAGSVLLGPAGLLAGLLLGGKSKEVTFVCEFKDGRKLLGSIDSKGYTEIQAALMNAPKQAKTEKIIQEKKQRKAEIKHRKDSGLAVPESQSSRVGKIIIISMFLLFLFMAVMAFLENT